MLFPFSKSFFMENFTPYLFNSFFNAFKSMSFNSKVSTLPFFTRSFTFTFLNFSKGLYCSVCALCLFISNIFFIKFITCLAVTILAFFTMAIVLLFISSFCIHSPTFILFLIFHRLILISPSFFLFFYFLL